MKEGAMVAFEGQVGVIRFRKSSHYEEMAVDFVPVDEGKVNTDRANDYFPIRKAYFELSAKEREEQKEQPYLREQLNTLYDAFVAKWGYFHANDNKEFIMLDSLGVEVFTIEMQVGKDIFKADIMREPVAFKKIDTDKKLTPTEALASCLNFYGCVDMDYLMQTTRKDEEEIIGDLKDEAVSLQAMSSTSAKRLFPVCPTSRTRERSGRKPPLKHWRPPYPNRYRLKNSISIWANAGSTRLYMPSLQQNFSERKPV